MGKRGRIVGERQPGRCLVYAAWFAITAAALLGCAPGRAPQHGGASFLAAHGDLVHCHSVLSDIDDIVDDAGVRDVEAHRVHGFPFLRSNRFLASFAGEDLNYAQWQQWLSRMRGLDRDGRYHELRNMSAADRRRVAMIVQQPGKRALVDDPEHLSELVELCAQSLHRAVNFEARGAMNLADAVQVPDSYQDWARILGLYPLTAFFIAAGYERWKRDNIQGFGDVSSIITSRRAVSYWPKEHRGTSDEEIAMLLRAAMDTPLGTAELDADLARTLAVAYAPVWIVDTSSEADRIGSAQWRGHDIAVDTTNPVVYYRISHTRLRDKVLFQINYLSWFPERPTTAPFDLLAGALDGVIWRVTLEPDGNILLYDTIHACGCYHLFFPRESLMARGRAHESDITEVAESPAAAPELAAGERLALYLAASSHYFRGVAKLSNTARAAGDTTYDLVPAEYLRSLPTQHDHYRSLFGADGMVHGSERLERFLLWPMGISSAGAMRQWGHHATAFVGRRHFDDPRLIEHAFIVTDGESPR